MSTNTKQHTSGRQQVTTNTQTQPPTPGPYNRDGNALVADKGDSVTIIAIARDGTAAQRHANLSWLAHCANIHADLLAACEAVRDILDPLVGEPNDRLAIARVNGIVRAAIRRAKGEG